MSSEDAKEVEAGKVTPGAFFGVVSAATGGGGEFGLASNDLGVISSGEDVSGGGGGSWSFELDASGEAAVLSGGGGTPAERRD